MMKPKTLLATLDPALPAFCTDSAPSWTTQAPKQAIAIQCSKAAFCLLVLATALAGCATPASAPQWNPVARATEAEYQPYLRAGSGTVTGQAFMLNRVGNAVKAAGRTVTLDPATSVGNEWWAKAGKFWVHRKVTPPSPAFAKARRTAVADADAKFTFSDLPPGKYYVRTEITWKVGNYNSVQGGLVGQIVEVRDGQTTDLTLNQPLQ
jgi:hypothetical protein